MLNRPSNPFHALIANLFPEMAGAGGTQMYPKRDPNGGPERFQNGPRTGSLDQLFMDMFEKPGAVRSFDGIRQPLTRGQKLMPGQGQIIPGEPYMPTVPNYGADQEPNDPMAWSPNQVWPQRPGAYQGQPTPEMRPGDEQNPFVPSGFRMSAPGSTLSSGKGFGYPKSSNDNLGSGSTWRNPANNDNSPAPIPLFPADFMEPPIDPQMRGAVPDATGRGIIDPYEQRPMDPRSMHYRGGGRMPGVNTPMPPDNPFEYTPRQNPPAEGPGMVQNASYTPAQQAMKEQGIDPNGPQAKAWEKLPGGQKDSPVTIQPKSARAQFLAHVYGAESGGNPNAKNPHSSATGLGQIITSTWNGLMRDYPELGLTANGRTDRDQSKRAVEQLATNYERYLRKSGIGVTPGTLYAAHFLGEHGAVQALRSPDSARMVDVVGPGVINANQFLARMTVGDFKAWAERKMSGKGRGGAGSDTTGAANSDIAGSQSMPAGGSDDGAHDYTAGLLPDEQQRQAMGGDVGVQEGDQSGGGQVIQDDGSAFLPYLEEMAKRRAANRQKRSNRRSYIQALLGDNRGANPN